MPTSNPNGRWPTLSVNDIQKYHAEGYLMLPGGLNEDVLAPVPGECMQPWGQAKGAYDPQGSRMMNSLLQRIHHHSESVRRHSLQGPLADIAEQLNGPHLKGTMSQLTFKMRGNTKPLGWHQDNSYGDPKATTPQCESAGFS